MVAGSSRVNALLGSVVFVSFQAEASTTLPKKDQRQLSSKPNILVPCWNLAVTCPLDSAGWRSRNLRQRRPESNPERRRKLRELEPSKVPARRAQEPWDTGRFQATLTEHFAV